MKPFSQQMSSLLILLMTLPTLIVFQSMKAFAESEPTLTIQLDHETKIYTRSELLQRKDLETLELTNTPTHPQKKISFSAVPLNHLFGRVRSTQDITILFRCQDGFSAPISPERLLNESKSQSIAYLAIEDPKNPWPKIMTGATLSSPGPFYVIWKNAKASQIKIEEWPYQVTRFEIKPSLKASYPQLYPTRSFKPEHAVMKGIKVFTQNCFTCHTMNLQGDSHFGPDLNVPHSPTEYFRDDYLKKFIRNPQSLRHWREDRMKGFPKTELSDSDLNHLISYLKEMARERSKSPRSLPLNPE